MNATVRIVVTSLAAVTLWLLSTGIAAGHTALSNADPTADARVNSAPTAITLTFTEAINPTFVNVVLTSADGRNWLSGEPRVDGPRVSATVASDAPPPGPYTVGYRVVSADGHPVSGSSTFTIVGVPAGVAPSPTSASAAPTSAAPPAAAPTGADTRTSVITAAVAGLALGGVIAFWQSRKHRRRKAVGYETRPADPPLPGDETTKR